LDVYPWDRWGKNDKVLPRMWEGQRVEVRLSLIIIM
jgi:hypothetical protein